MGHLLPHSISAGGLNFLSAEEEGDYFSAKSVEAGAKGSSNWHSTNLYALGSYILGY